MAASSLPDVETQKREITELMRKSLVKGDIWYLVDCPWWKQWKKFVGFHTWDQFGVGEELNNPGPINNSSLLVADGCTLKDHLIDELDVNFLPQEAWFKLVSWYGVVSDHQALPRKVVEHGMYVKSLKVEVYLMEFKLCWKSDPKTIVTRQFSRRDTIGHVMSEMRKIFAIAKEAETRVWTKYMRNTYELLSNLEYTVQDAGLYLGQVILIEQKIEDGTWGKPQTTLSSQSPSTLVQSNDDEKSAAALQKKAKPKPKKKTTEGQEALRPISGLKSKKSPRETKTETKVPVSTIGNGVTRQQVDSERNTHEKNVRVSATESKYSASDAGPVKPTELPNVKQDSKQLDQGSNANDNWLQVQCDVMEMRKLLNEEKRARNIRKQELLEKETVLINTLQSTLFEEQQARTRVEEELSQARSACNELEERLQNDLARIRQTLEDEIRMRNTRERELREKEMIVDQLQKTLREEQQAKTRVTEQLREARGVCNNLEGRLQNEMLARQTLQQELQMKENAVGEQRRLLEEERQQKMTLEERQRNLELQMQEETNRHLSTERELQSAVSAAQEELTEYQRRQPRDWIIQREEILLSDTVLGKGAWGNVREGTFRSCQVAVKEIHELILSPHNRRLFEREMSIASCCRHPNLLQFIGATNDDGSPLFVTELLDTSLRHMLTQRELNHNEVVSLASDVAKGLNYLHLNKPLPIIHRDISSANVLLWRRDEYWRAKLSDYGAANFMRQCMTVNPGAIIYSAPEALTSHQSPKVDVYSFGLLLCEMCVRELPVPQEVDNQIGQVTNGVLRRLIERCVKKDPEQRPTMSDVICELEELAKTKSM